MKKIRTYIGGTFLLLSAFFVLLTVIIPGKRLALGKILLESYQWTYSVIAFVICVCIYFLCAKDMEENAVVGGLKLLLSLSFVISLISNIVFMF